MTTYRKCAFRYFNCILPTRYFWVQCFKNDDKPSVCLQIFSQYLSNTLFLCSVMLFLLGWLLPCPKQTKEGQTSRRRLPRCRDQSALSHTRLQISRGWDRGGIFLHKPPGTKQQKNGLTRVTAASAPASESGAAWSQATFQGCPGRAGQNTSRSEPNCQQHLLTTQFKHRPDNRSYISSELHLV
jgi:hypothetical protein